MTPLLFNLYIFLMGLCVGSFLNVCIYRLPAGRSIVRPASACTGCATPIHWYDNLPVVSYLILRGRCRTCRTTISPRYPIVELLTASFGLALWMRFGWQPQTVVYFLFVATLLVITFIDIDHRIIPDAISLPGIPIGLFCSFFLPQPGWQASLIGILIGGGSLYAVAWGYSFLKGREGMGGGDIKLLAMIGAFIGWQGVLFTVLTSSFIGTLAGITLMLRSRKGMEMAVPFGPFLAIGAILYIFFGPQWIDWYINRFLI